MLYVGWGGGGADLEGGELRDETYSVQVRTGLDDVCDDDIIYGEVISGVQVCMHKPANVGMGHGMVPTQNPPVQRSFPESTSFLL